MTPKRSPRRWRRSRSTIMRNGRAAAALPWTNQRRARSPMRSRPTSVNRRRQRWRRPFFQPTLKTRGATMSSTSDKAKGVANEAIGKAKQGVGKAVDSDKMKGEGAAQEAKGHLQQGVGKAKDAVKSAVDKI